MVTNAEAGLHWLARNRPTGAGSQALARIVGTAIEPAKSSAGSGRSSRRCPRGSDSGDQPGILEVIALTRSEAFKIGVSVRTQFAEGLPLIQGDRVQLQQVILNLIVNAIEAMSGVGERRASC